MKWILSLITFVVPVFAIAAMPADFSADFSPENVVEAHLHNIQNKVRSCVVLPFTMKDGHRMYKNLMSHCADVRVLPQAEGQKAHLVRAIVKIGGSQYQIRMQPSPDSYDDLFDIAIREPRSGDVYILRQVPAFGDIWLGILGGRQEGLRRALWTP
jgi:hypothetical protein